MGGGGTGSLLKLLSTRINQVRGASPGDVYSIGIKKGNRGASPGNKNLVNCYMIDQVFTRSET